MVRNYKWNVDKNMCENKIKDSIMKIILNNDNFINLHILVDILNNDKSFNFRYENKQKTVTNFLKSNYKGIINFLKIFDEFIILEKNKNIFVSINNKEELFQEFDGWLFINKTNLV